MNHHKEAIKKHIQNLPFGESVLLPMARFILQNKYYVKMRKGLCEKREADYILKSLKSNDFTEAVIAYDMKVSPPTYGDFFYVVMIARFFLIMGKKVNFFIINSEFRKDMLDAYDDEGCRGLVVSLSELPKVILTDNNCDTQITNWHDISVKIDNFEKQGKTLIVFKHKVKNRESIYNHCFNLSNYLAASMDNNQIEKFLLRKNEIDSRVNIKYPKLPYITWAARYSEKWGFDRNITENDFTEIYLSLHSLYPSCAIMIVSDEIGCNYFKKLARKNNLPCLFSKDFSDTFMGDCALIIGSDYFFQLRGGGICTAAIYSSLPYHMVFEPVHETAWEKNSLAVWSHNKQNWEKGTEGWRFRTKPATEC
ncbi:MAG: hypothetical protein WCQ90_07190 [Deltaproteobacteria bacterium]